MLFCSQLGALAGLLLPYGNGVEYQREHCCGLNGLNQSAMAVGLERLAKGRGAQQHAQQQHHIHEAHHLGFALFRGEVCGQGKARGLNRVQTGAHKEKGHCRGQVPNPYRRIGRLAGAC